MVDERRVIYPKPTIAGVNYANPWTMMNALKPPTPTTSTTPSRTTSTGVVPSTTSSTLASALAPKPSTTPNNVAELRALYAKALAELTRQQGVGRENIAGSVSRMKADPMNTANAYAALQGVNPRVAANPIAEYASATGVSDSAARAAQGMAESDAAAYQAVSQNIADIMRTSQEAANQSRMADIGLIETGGTQDLESQANMLNLLLKQGEIGSVTGLQQRNLENEIAMRNALTGQVSNIFAGQDVAPESILKLIEATMAKLNMNRWA